MPDEPRKTDDDAAVTGPVVPFDALEKLIDKHDATMARVTEQLAARNTPTPTPAAAPNPEDLARQWNAAKEKADEMAAAGQVAGAMEYLYQEQQKLTAAATPKVDDRADFKAMVSSAKRSSRLENKEIFDKYGSEIEAFMANKAPEDRINPDAWDDAARHVRSSHVDDILAERDAEWEARIEKIRNEGTGWNTPLGDGSTPGRRAVDRSGGSADLTPDDLMGADMFGMSPTEYAAAKKRASKARLGFNVVSLVDELPESASS